MSGSTHLARDEILEDVLAIATQRLAMPQRKESALFIRQYYRRAPREDLAGRQPEDLYFAAIAMQAFLRQREPHRDKLRVYNPDMDADGWSTTHSVIDLITDDRPFLVDSIIGELNRTEVPVHLVLHPIIRVCRDETGALQEIVVPGGESDGAIAESVIRIEISRHADGDALAALRERLIGILGDVRAAVEDWRAMTAAMVEAIADLENTTPVGLADDVEENVAFLSWAMENNFTLLGSRTYDLVEGDGGPRWALVDGTSRGIFRRQIETEGAATAVRERPIAPEVMDYVQSPGLLIITKTRRHSTVHRPVHMDSISVKRFGADGRTVGVHRFLGLFTSSAHHQSPSEIPLLRQKVAIALARAGFLPVSHAGKSLLNILETYPRDELFQIRDDELLEVCLGILHLQDRPRLRLFVRRDTFDRFVSCLVFVPRDRYDSTLRERISAILSEAFGGRCEAFYTQLGESLLAQLHLIIRAGPDGVPDFDRADIEHRLVEAARGWEEHLADALVVAHEEHTAELLERRYLRAFDGGYKDRHGARQAVQDIERIERARDHGGIELNLYRPPESADDAVRFKIYHPAEPVPLSDVLPMLENMGFRVIDEIPACVTPANGSPVWIHDFGIADRSGGAVDVGRVKQIFQEAFEQVWLGKVEDDGFNQLVVRAGLSARQVAVLRAYCKYLRQAEIQFSQDYMERTLADNPGLARLLLEYFESRFAPGSDNRPLDALEAEILTEIDALNSLDEDRIARRFLNVVKSTLRTNYYQPDADDRAKSYLSFKIDSSAVDELPLPRPMVEIFVYSPRMEGIHLRGGMVARGGLRWSDRPQDFRTEVLGLMKAQMVKNAVIVPVGSKGGFVVKQMPDGGRDRVMAEVVACYKTLIRGMLDISDNIVDGTVVPPADVVRCDGDDPYLVVAADKGTATFSDLANGVARDYGFWLDDAFASGGSAGYDHKKMAITARGAWESVKRHFREMDLDTQKEPFGVVGIGDMSGDVFGNGMLLSPHIKLYAAFNHLHIFLDPDPDSAASFAERERLFELPRSSWTDYDVSLISPGGGIFERTAKSIALSTEIRARLGIDAESLTPNQLITALLKAPVDLLWNGGIGTYVKAKSESQADAGDRANDAVRIDGVDLRCRVVGEGGNLGLTQLARIEAAQAGVRINTDAIDNSAGVDCSDHEVNIKILLGDVVASGDMTLKQRDALLVEMTDEVAEQCLRDNYLQTQGISVIEAQGAEKLEVQVRLMQTLERGGRLDRAVEFLPDAEVLDQRRAARQGLTRPEVSVLFAYVKNALYDDLLASDLPDDPSLESDLFGYFPRQLREKYPERILGHKLRREIISTRVANSLVNRASMVFPMLAEQETGRGAADIARAYVVARDVLGLRAVWEEIEHHDNRVPSACQADMIYATRELMEHAVLWFLRQRPHPLDAEAAIGAFGPGVRSIRGALATVLPDQVRETMEAEAARLHKQGVDEGLARTISGVPHLFAACDIVDVANRLSLDVIDAAGTYYRLGARLGLDWLRARAREIKAETHWQRQAVTAIVDELYGQQRAITGRVAESAGGGSEAVERWMGNNAERLSRSAHMLTELRSADMVDLAMLAVANREIRALTDS